MKRIVFVLKLLLIALFLQAQSSYEEAIRQGDDAFRKDQFDVAISKYWAAEAFDPTHRNEVKERVNRVFLRIESLRLEAIQAREEAEAARQKVEVLLVEAQESRELALRNERLALIALHETEKIRDQLELALEQANKLVNAFYFYDNKYALAFAGRRYFYIDKLGDPQQHLGYWDHAEQFNFEGLARVERNGVQFLLDTLGNTYRVVTDVRSIDDESRALDLSRKNLSQIPRQVFRHSQLQILLVNNNHISAIHPRIGQLTNLIRLDASNNEIRAIPEEIAQLTHLKELNLRFNQISTLPPELTRLQQLERISLAFNDLDRLPAEVGQLENLRVLELGNNRLQQLPGQTGDLSRLSSLNLRGNQLKSLPVELARLEALEHVDFTDNHITSFNPSLIENTTNLALLRELGRITFSARNYKEAVSIYHRIIGLQSHPAVTDYRNAGLSYYFAGEHEIALDYFNYYMQQRSDDPWTMNIIGRVYFDMQQYDKAYQTIKLTLDIDSDNYLNWYHLSLYALYAGQPEEAIYAARKSLQLMPEVKTVNKNLALGYLLNDQWTEAEEIFSEWKGRYFPEDADQRYTNYVFLEDILRLQQSGVDHPDLEKAKELLTFE